MWVDGGRGDVDGVIVLTMLRRSNRCFSHCASVFAVLFCLYAFITVFALVFKLDLFLLYMCLKLIFLRWGGGVAFFAFHINFPKQCRTVLRHILKSLQGRY